MPTQKKAARLDFVGNSGLDFVGWGEKALDERLW
jgi:hypothetical protein